MTTLQDQVWITACTRSMIRDIAALRAKGLYYKDVAEKAGFCQNTIRRYLRLYEKYGEKIFAEDS